MNKLSLVLAITIMFFSCGKDKSKTTSDGESTSPETEASADASSYDPNRGIGKHTAVDLGAGLDLALATKGEKIADVKCLSCHKLSDERLVGPGWKGVSERKAPQWIMNFITDPDPMIDKDPELQAQLEICLVRMPNQSLDDTDARAILEFMRKNDGVK